MINHNKIKLLFHLTLPFSIWGLGSSSENACFIEGILSANLHKFFRLNELMRFGGLLFQRQVNLSLPGLFGPM